MKIVIHAIEDYFQTNQYHFVDVIYFAIKNVFFLRFYVININEYINSKSFVQDAII